MPHEKNVKIILFIVVIVMLFLFALIILPKSSVKTTDETTPDEIISDNTASEYIDTKNSYGTLSVPTQIIKLDHLYFIVDCYHNQVIYHDNLQDPLSQWSVLTDNLNRGHTIAAFDDIYLMDDTENNQVLVYQKKNNSFSQIQILDNIGVRPHYTFFDKKQETFYVWSSMTGELYCLKRDTSTDTIYISDIRKIEKLNNVYVRTITIIDDKIYFVSGNSSIICAQLNTFEILEEYSVPPELSGMVQLEKIQDYYYITVSTDVTGNADYATIVRTADLHSLIDYDYESIFDYFDKQGTPYYLGQIEDHWYLTTHRYDGVGIWQFDIIDNAIENVTLIY